MLDSLPPSSLSTSCFVPAIVVSDVQYLYGSRESIVIGLISIVGIVWLVSHVSILAPCGDHEMSRACL